MNHRLQAAARAVSPHDEDDERVLAFDPRDESLIGDTPCSSPATANDFDCVIGKGLPIGGERDSCFASAPDFSVSLTVHPRLARCRTGIELSRSAEPTEVNPGVVMPEIREALTLASSGVLRIAAILLRDCEVPGQLACQFMPTFAMSKAEWRWIVSFHPIAAAE